MQLQHPHPRDAHFKNALGRYGEAIAARCLTDSGHRVIEVNWRCGRGEIDIIAAEGRTLVICEVKTRSSLAFGEPAEAVGVVKSQRLRLLAGQWLAEHPGDWESIRFDVVSVLRRERGPAQVRHLRAAF
ncbi:MAG TPA: YraN family protein [Jatrophihabitans sp.]|jgi:putative endonuclease|uniref:YraN family protein n=1 Tax=Jatrophihabitans sp. TaxID=1932789 RepID=UPI002F24C59E